MCKQAVDGVDGKSEITAISNKYKDIFDDLINSSDTEFLYQPEFPDWPGLIDNGTRNTPRSRGTLLSLFEDNCLNKNILFIAFE